MRILLGIFIILLAGGCTSHRFKSWKRGSQWALVRVELEKERLAQKGNLPVLPPPTADEFGRAPLAEGELGVTEDGRVVCRINFIERAPGGAYVYEAVRFLGMLRKNASRIELVRPAPDGVPLGVTTVLHVQELPSGQLRVQGATQETLLPYVYYFAPPPARAGRIALPTVVM